METGTISTVGYRVGLVVVSLLFGAGVPLLLFQQQLFSSEPVSSAASWAVWLSVIIVASCALLLLIGLFAEDDFLSEWLSHGTGSPADLLALPVFIMVGIGSIFARASRCYGGK